MRILPHPNHVITTVFWIFLFGLLAWAVVVTLMAIVLVFP